MIVPLGTEAGYRSEVAVVTKLCCRVIIRTVLQVHKGKLRAQTHAKEVGPMENFLRTNEHMTTRL